MNEEIRINTNWVADSADITQIKFFRSQFQNIENAHKHWVHKIRFTAA